MKSGTSCQKEMKLRDTPWVAKESATWLPSL